jgi:hypothetical protein
MQLAPSIVAVDPRRFGRRPRRVLAHAPRASTLSADLRLFATTFLAGFIFVSVLIA